MQYIFSLDCQPNAKGKVKPRYRHTNSSVVGKLRRKLVDGGIYYQGKDTVRGLALLQLYIDTQHHPLFDKSKQEIGLAALCAGKMAYGIKDYSKAERFPVRGQQNGPIHRQDPCRNNTV